MFDLCFQSRFDRLDVFGPKKKKFLINFQETIRKFHLTGICAVVIVAPENATFGLGGLIPSIMVSFVTSDCLRSGRLLCKNQRNHSVSFNSDLFEDFISNLKKPDETRLRCSIEQIF